MTSAFGQALLDHHRGTRTEPLYQRDGETVLEHPIEDFYFDEFEDSADSEWFDARIEGPVLDMGAGAGRDALHFQKRSDVVAIEIAAELVTLLEERGVADPRHGNMFSLREQFEPDRFRSAYALGTQIGLARSIEGLVAFLGDLDVVTTADATAVFDAYDPTREAATDMLGFRSDESRGLAYRVITYEYGATVDETLLFRLFSPSRFRLAAGRAGWRVTAIRRPHESYHYRVALTKA